MAWKREFYFIVSYSHEGLASELDMGGWTMSVTKNLPYEGWKDIMINRLCVYKIPILVSPILSIIYFSPATVKDRQRSLKCKCRNFRHRRCRKIREFTVGNLQV
jgi:hypothetical protein